MASFAWWLVCGCLCVGQGNAKEQPHSIGMVHGVRLVNSSLHATAPIGVRCIDGAFGSVVNVAQLGVSANPAREFAADIGILGGATGV